MDDQDLELEKARLLSLALDFGFDEDSANKCLDRLIKLYGEDGKDFISVEHCGDDFLAALAESTEDSEEWDYLQNMESEACGDLENILEYKVLNNDNTDNGHGRKRNCNAIDCSSASLENPNFVELDSSRDSGLDFRIRKKKYVESTNSYCPDFRGSSFKQNLGEHCSKSLVTQLPCTACDSQNKHMVIMEPIEDNG